MKVVVLETGWEDHEFENKVQTCINQVDKFYRYKDIKISSSHNKCMILFEETI